MTFSEESLSKLRECHEDLQKIHALAITRSDVDYKIIEGYRSPARQQSLYLQGKTKIDGVTRKGKHNYNPSMATDIIVWHPDKAVREKIMYNPNYLSYIAGVMDSCAKELKERGEITHDLRWGGNWDDDGEIITDQAFDDLVHFELCD